MSDTQSKAVTSAELEIKRRGRRRLIGAATLGLLAIVFLPMIFDSEPKKAGTDSKEISITVPSQDGQPPLAAPVVSSTVPASPASAEEAVANKEPLPPVVAEAETVPTQPVVPTVKPADALTVASAVPVAKPAKPAEAKAAEPKPVKPSPAPTNGNKTETTAKSGFAVQLGAFNDEDNIKQVVAKMKESKLPVHTEKIAVKTGTVTRIRVGPYATREKAEQALVQIKKAGSDGKVVPL